MLFGRRSIIRSQTNGRLVILSDLHIWGPDDPLYRGLLRFVKEELRPGDAFFMVGDVFDIFIGTKDVFVSKYQALLSAIKQRADVGDIEVYYLEGNHDFSLSGLFGDSRNAKVLTSEFVYEWDGRRILFNHGDRINPHDYGYKAWRFALHNPLSKFIIASTPGKLIDSVGVKLSSKSRTYNQEPSEETVRLFRNYACEQISKGHDFVVLGHSHYLDDMKFQCGDHMGQYVNVGFPRRDHRYLEILPGEQQIRFESWKRFILPVLA